MAVRVCDICDIAGCKRHAPKFAPKSLRDEFAMAAPEIIAPLQANLKEYAEWAYEYADAMMEARKK